MKAGCQGTFVISWSQTETDGVRAGPLSLLTVGATWRWTGAAVRVDGPQGVLVLNGANGVAEMRQRAAQVVRRLTRGVGRASAVPEPAADLPDQSFSVTDGRDIHTISLITAPDTGANLLILTGELPPADRDLWVVATALDRNRGGQDARGVICFTPGTRLLTPQGLRPIEHLRGGDLIETRDNGPQKVLWTGHRAMTGARLYAMPHLRPIRFRAAALGRNRPDLDLLVSPQHRMLVRGRAAQALFNCDEVLVAAQDLLNDTTITVDRSLRAVTYVHIMLEHHNILWANGMETESFHPANSDLAAMDPAQRGGLLDLMPTLARDPHSYGDPARRNLTASEAAILRHDMLV